MSARGRRRHLPTTPTSRVQVDGRWPSSQWVRVHLRKMTKKLMFEPILVHRHKEELKL